MDKLKWKDGVDPLTINLEEQIELAEDIFNGAKELHDVFFSMLKQNKLM